MTTSKSPRKVATEALAAGTRALPLYSHRNSPKVYTQPQLFACLVLKQFFRTDYRGVVAILHDLPDLVAALSLKDVPHHTTLQKACRRLLGSDARVGALLTVTVRRAIRPRRKRVPLAAMDSSGFDLGHASRYYVRRRSKGQDRSEPPSQNITYRHYAKLELVFDCATHAIVGVLSGRGPRPDTDRFVPLLDEALSRVRIGTTLADAGYDSEPNHVHARQQCGVRSVIPAEAGRPTDKPPAGRYRRLMKRNLTEFAGFLYCRYGQRWQAECGFSMIKRRQRDFIAARTGPNQRCELMLIVLTHNLMIAYFGVFYRAGHY